MIRVAFVGHREPAYRDAIDLVDALRPFVPPRHVIARTGRDHLDLGVTGQAFGDVSRIAIQRRR
jgi:hypothetical protein